MSKRQNKIFFFSFICLWSAMILWNIIEPNKVFSQHENRYLAQFPSFQLDEFIDGEYMKDLDSYIDDQFIMRSRWVQIKALQERILGKQEVNNVYIGKDDYLIEKNRESDLSFEQLEKNIEHLYNFLLRHVEELGEDRISVMMIPSSSEILKDKLPTYANPYNQEHLIQSIYDSLPKGITIDINGLLKEKSKEYIYYRTDHHWTSLGAYYSYLKWANHMGIQALLEDDFNVTIASNDFYGTIHSKVNMNVKPDTIHLYEIKEDMEYELEFNQMEKSTSLFDRKQLEGKDKYSVYLGGNNALVEIESKLENDKRVLVIKDSYAHSFLPFLVNHYEETHVIDLRYYNGSIDEYMEENNITDILVLYHGVGFVNDINIPKLSR